MITEGAANQAQIARHFEECDEIFISHLSLRVSIPEYIAKIFKKAHRYEYWSGDRLVGLVAVYSNPEFDYVTNVSVVADFTGKKIASNLMERCIDKAERDIRLEVSEHNIPALKLYDKFGFKPEGRNEETKYLILRRVIS